MFKGQLWPLRSVAIMFTAYANVSFCIKTKEWLNRCLTPAVDLCICGDTKNPTKTFLLQQ